MKKFFVLWSSQSVSLFGSSVVGFALAWYLTLKTGSATILSTAMMVNFMPPILLGPFAGPLIDRWNRKKIMICGDLITTLQILILVFLFYNGTVRIWTIYAVMAGMATSSYFQRIALSASISMIVPEKQLVRANGLMMMLANTTNLLAPLAGAFLMEAFRMQWVLSVDNISAIVSIGCLLPLAIPQPVQRANLAVKPGYFSDMKETFRYISSWRGLLVLVVLFAMVNFFAAPLTALLPLFVTKYLGASVVRLGWLGTAFAAGAIAGGLALSAWSGFKRRIVTTLLSTMIWGLSAFMFGFIAPGIFLLGTALRFIAGMSNAMLNAPVGAMLQSIVAKDIQGRVFSLQNSLVLAMFPLSLAIAGPLVDAIGLRTIWYVAGAGVFIMVTAGFFSRDLMNIEEQKMVTQPAEAPPTT